MPSNLTLFVVLVAGFVFLSRFQLAFYITSSWDSTRLILWSGLWGGVLFFLSRLLVLRIQGWGLAPSRIWENGLEHELIRTSELVFPEEGVFLGSLLGTMALALILPIMLNIGYRFAVPEAREAEFAVWRARKSIDNALLLMLISEVGTGRPIAFTMADSKVYVGFVLSHPGLKRPWRSGEKQYFSILPTQSGYRDKDNRDLRLKRNYAPLLAAIQEGKDPAIKNYSLDDLRVLLPMEDVLSARLFDEEIFRRLFRQVLPESPADLNLPHEETAQETRTPMEDME